MGMRAKKFISMTAVAAMVWALVAVLAPTAALATTCCYNMKNANGKFMGASGNNIIVSTTAIFWTSLNDGNYLTLWDESVNKNLGLSGNSTANGTQAIRAAGSSSYTQDWRLYLYNGGPYYQMKSRANLNKCLGISGGASGTYVQLFACATSGVPTNQLWTQIRTNGAKK
jgi:hypothetical protein